MEFPLLLVPIETKSREFKSRLYFASTAIKYGYRVWMGPSRTIHNNLSKFPKGLIIENDATSKSLSFVKDAKNLGHKLIAWDEESISTINDQFYVNHRISRDVLNRYEYFFTRGMHDAANIIESYKNIEDKVIPSGNPRIDILRPELNNFTYNPDGPIVIMSRFSRSNPFSITRKHAEDNATKKFNLKGNDEIFYRKYLKHCHNIFDLFFPMVLKLVKKFPNKKFLVRPHPSEKISTWQELCDANDNLDLDKSLTAEIIASKSSLVIHNGCTTGLEAALIGIPVISYMPISSKKYDVDLPNIVSTKCKTLNSLYEEVQRILETKISLTENQQKSWQIVRDNWIGNKTYETATNIILKNIESLRLENSLKTLLTRKITLFKLSLRKLRLSISNLFQPTDHEMEKKRTEYYKQKLPKIKKNEILSILNNYDDGDFVINEAVYDWWEIYSD